MHNHRKLLENCILVDVRSPGEFNTGHIEGSLNIPLGCDLNEMKASCPNLDANIVVFCASGMRSSTFKTLIEQIGYKNVINGGGISSIALTLNKNIVR